ncbi:MAG TPA: hypothetical protein VNI84_19325 [Pyrinomonadaceae bacterium]|nr:hypothetical protein [Pyrinomonadaceae bacterium]
MKNYQNELSEENAVERWENEGGGVKPLPELRTNDKKILACIACLTLLPFIYWLVKRI